nr:hypothetical protein [Leifsonia sp. 71-9]
MRETLGGEQGAGDPAEELTRDAARGGLHTGHVDQRRASLDRGGYCVGGAHIHAPGAAQHDGVMTGGVEGGDDVPPDDAGAAGDGDPHRVTASVRAGILCRSESSIPCRTTQHPRM